MSIFSRRKRLLNRTPRAPKMSSRRQFHRALRRHPAWPMVMEQAAARAKAHREQEAARERLIKEQAAAQKQLRRAARRAKFHRLTRRGRTNVTEMPQTSSRTQVRRALRRNRELVAALLAVGALLVVLTGLAVATGDWRGKHGLEGGVGGPKPRFGAASTFDMNNNAMLIFGGFTGAAGETPVAADDTWTFSGYGTVGNWKWNNRTPAISPSPRGFASMAYDEARRNTVLFGGALNANFRSNEGSGGPGGAPGPVYGDTWIWDGSHWTVVNPPEPRPEARQNASMVYDAHRKVVVMFGGHGVDSTTVGTALNDTWTWDGSRWKIMSSTGAPSPRQSAAMAYDVCRAKAVMFGGVRIPAPSPGTPVNEPGETWTWNGTSWAQEHPPSTPLLSPSPRVGASMTYSPLSGRVLLYGGLGVSDTGTPTVAVDQDFWMWDGAGWEKANSETYGATALDSVEGGAGPGTVLPPPRAYASFVYDRSAETFQNYAHLLGGTPAGQSPQVVLADQWWLLSRGDVVNAGGAGSDPRKCENPVPVPPDDAPTGVVQSDDDGQAPTVAASRGIRDTGLRLPVLVGTDWPGNNRNPKIGNNPNPNYTPPPDCPNSATGETGTNTHLATDPKRNRVYQFFPCDPKRGSGQPDVPKLLVRVYDGATLKPLASAVLPIKVSPVLGSESSFSDLVMHDLDRGRFYLVSGGSSNRTLWVVQQDLIEQGINPVVKPPITLSGTSLTLSFFNHPATGRAKLLINRGTTISQVDLELNHEDWAGAATGCTTMGPNTNIGGSRATFAMRSGNRAYNVCTVSGQRYGVVAIPVEPDPADASVEDGEKAGTAEVFPGPFTVKTNWGDPQTGRMLLFSSGRGGAVIWTFDGKTSRYVGRAGFDSYPFASDAQFGLDRETGRLYIHAPDDIQPGYRTQGGVLALDARLTPTPQAVKFPEFSSLPAAPIATLPPEGDLPRRVFIRRRGGSMKTYPDGAAVKLPNEMFYTILADEIPIPAQPDLAQLDALTIPVAEAPGKTEVTFDAEGSGYGVRLRSVGGIWSALRPIASIYNPMDDTSPVEAAILTQSAFIPTCVFPDRELVAGLVPQARLSELDAAVQARGLDVDSNSKTDLQGPFSRCTPPVGPAYLPLTARPVTEALLPLLQLAQTQGDSAVGPNLTWSKFFNEVECVGDASNVTQTTGADVYGSADCKQKQGRVEGVARSNFAVTNTAFSVGEGYSKVTVGRDPAKGVVVTATAVATGIRLSDVSIGMVKTEAVAWSNGRPGEKRASFTRTICWVTSPRFEHEKECLTEDEQKDFVKKWNDGWGINSKMILPKPDPDLYKGSPGGYIAGVIKPLADETEDQLFAKDFQKEVPGLVIEFYKDSTAQGLGRQVLQLAAVRAVSGYGVQCNAELVYSPSAKGCVALAFEDEFTEELEEDEEVLSSSDDAEFDSAGSWEPVLTDAPAPLALGSRLGRFIENLPLVRLLPIRQMGEALLAASVWLLLGLPLLLASQRFAMNRARGVE